jgi:hypothetical protein
MERGLPIGCAPGIQVSLVLLPEECRSLSSRKFPWAEAKRRALRSVAGVAIRARQARFDRDRRKAVALLPPALQRA